MPGQGELCSMRKMLAVLLLVLPLSLSKAQTAPAMPVEPTAIGIVYHLDPTTQELRPLPDEPWKEHLRQQHPFGATFIRSVEISGGRSSFRLKATEKDDFVFKTGSPEQVALYLTQQVKKKRSFDFKKEAGPDKQPIKGIPVEVSTYGERSYKLIPSAPLAPGEYAINIAGEVYTFGVDQ